MEENKQNTDTQKYYEFPHSFVQALVNYLMQRPYGEVVSFLDQLRNEIVPKAESAASVEK